MKPEASRQLGRDLIILGTGGAESKGFVFRAEKIRLEGKRGAKAWGTSLAAKWLRIRLPMQGTRVRALVWEDPICHGATKPVYHNY